ncbi:MAG: site-specific integrase [Actinomycetota bacterium]|nr:site-specific integrase [Actinomycetota bacterium]
MASIAKRPDGQYRARYRDSGGREHSKHFPRKVDAQRWLNEVTASIVTGNYVDPKNSRVTVRTYATEWQRVQVGRSSTLTILDNALRLHVLPELGDQPIGSVRKSDLQGLIKALEVKGLSAGSIRNIYDAAARMFAAAVDDRVIPASPCRRIILPTKSDLDVVPPTLEQVRAIEGAMGERGAAIVVLAGSGLRIGELLGLQVRDVDFLRRTIRVERQRLQSGRLGPTKSPKSVRTVPVGQVVIDALAAHLSQQPSHGDLFLDPSGRGPMTYRQWKPLWAVATTAAGVDFTTHGLRHFYASALIAGGASVRQVQAVLGHSSAVITLRTYAHLWPGDDDRTRSIIDAVLGEAADQVRTREVT